MICKNELVQNVLQERTAKHFLEMLDSKRPYYLYNATILFPIGRLQEDA